MLIMQEVLVITLESRVVNHFTGAFVNKVFVLAAALQLNDPFRSRSETLV